VAWSRDPLCRIWKLQNNLGDLSARSSLRPEFDRSQVASRPEDRAVELGASGERYLGHGQVVGPATVQQSHVLPQSSYGTRPKTTAEARQMDSARVEAGPVGLPPGPGVLVQGPRAREIGYELPSDLGQPNQPSGAHTYPPPRKDVQPRGTLVPCLVAEGDQTMKPWLRAPSLASGLSSFPTTPESRMEGFIAEARGTCQTTNTAVVSQCVTGGSGPPSTQHSQASSASGEAKSKNPLFKLQWYNGSACLETFCCNSSILPSTCSEVRMTASIICALAYMNPLDKFLGSCRRM